MNAKELAEFKEQALRAAKVHNALELQSRIMKLTKAIEYDKQEDELDEYDEDEDDDFDEDDEDPYAELSMLLEVYKTIIKD